MARDGTGHQYTLAEAVSYETPMFGKKPSERAILYYLRLRELERKGRVGATQNEIIDHTGMTERTVGDAVRALFKAGSIK